MDAIGSFVAKKAFESKVDSFSKDISSSLGLGGDDDAKGSSRPVVDADKRARDREAEERRNQEREEAHKKRKEQTRAKANALREKYGLPTDAPASGSSTRSATPYKGSTSPSGFSSMSQCCVLF